MCNVLIVKRWPGQPEQFATQQIYTREEAEKKVEGLRTDFPGRIFSIRLDKSIR